MAHHIVVLGAGYAGLSAAKGVARRLRRAPARVTLVNAAGHFVERVRLHQLAAGRPPKEPPLRDLLAGTGVGLRVARVTAVDAAARTVRLDSAPHVIPYDTLVYALGSEADTTVPGAATHASTVATHRDAVRLRERTAAARGSLVVAGAGLTGIETATELAEAHPGLHVRLVTAGALGAGLAERGRRYLRDALRRHGVAPREHSPVAEVTPDGLLLACGDEIPAGTVVWTAGFRAPDLARAAGFAVDVHGRLAVDATLRSLSHPEVFAAGDAAAATGPDGAPCRMSCQTGLPMGAYVARAVAATVTGRVPPPLRLRHVWRNISLGRDDGLTQFTRADDHPVAALLTGRPSAHFKEAVTRGTVLALRR
ncbi:oxidoreductase [Streptomyces sp. AJS327]|uniref:NAD(P)/FAD-dependent oxidoreductase n=1 Tax=Streptomyces sp. AJS327 TaxID=2545265 RepID=UPI0015DE5B9A|nr:FAD-dependent oxidoreductase [Streptomyces sp. AJS327]MBA0051655.1 oxidoreductase [Streptomyces sp. AJS327]